MPFGFVGDVSDQERPPRSGEPSTGLVKVDAERLLPQFQLAVDEDHVTMPVLDHAQTVA
jgi:hypothetical protein